MLVKCICTNCAGHLEFEEENAGESIPCPHCGFKTVLELPGTQAPNPELLRLWRRRRLRQKLCWAGAALLVLGGLGAGLYFWGVPWVEDLLPSVDTTAKALTVLVLGCLVLPFAVAWLVLPVVLMWQFRQLLGVLAQLAPKPLAVAEDEELLAEADEPIAEAEAPESEAATPEAETSEAETPVAEEEAELTDEAEESAAPSR